MIVAFGVAAGLAIGAVTLQPRDAKLPSTEDVVASFSPPSQPTRIGINLTTPLWWNGERAFMNLAAGGTWSAAGNGPWTPFDPARLDPGGDVVSLKPGEQAILVMTPPTAIRFGAVPIRCRFEGQGAVDIFPNAGAVTTGNVVDFTWAQKASASFLIKASNPADPVRHIDCRERDADPKTLFHPAFLDSIRPFYAMRFLDWQGANMNLGGHWARRTPANATVQAGPEGVAVENLVALSNQTGVNPWYVMPWKADAVYVRNFAQYVHDHLDPKRTIYLEIGNEAWNTAFPIGQQLLAEIKTSAPGKDANVARMEAYADKVVFNFKIWEDVFRDNPKRLVRILSGQAAWPDLIRPALAYRDTAKHVDALSSGPYFGQTLMADAAVPTKTLDKLFADLDASIEPAIQNSLQFRAIAEQHGLRYIAYEAGQHVTYTGPDETAIRRLNQDPRMGVIYAKYLAAWRRRVGDVIMMFASAGPISRNAAWGLSEYEGQSLSEAPKRKAVLEAIGGLDSNR